VIGYFEKISSTRLNALSAAACGAIPSFIMSTQPTLQTCSFWTWALSWVEDPELRHGRAKQGLLDVSHHGNRDHNDAEKPRSAWVRKSPVCSPGSGRNFGVDR
jgi:hypothetical protein